MYNNKLKQRFVKDYGYQIPVFEEPYWSFYLDLYPGCERDWDSLIDCVENNYSGNVEEFISDMGKTRDSIIEHFKSHPKYLEFLNSKLDQFEINGNEYKNLPRGDIYNNECADGVTTYMSVDLKKANIQALRYYSPDLFKVGSVDPSAPIDQLWDSFTAEFCSNEDAHIYLKNSKYLRQAVFGNLKPERQIKIEKFMVLKAFNKIKTERTIFSMIPLCVNSDEVVVKTDSTGDVLWKDKYGDVAWIELEELRKQRIEVRIDMYKLSRILFETSNKHIIDIYSKDFGGTHEYKKISTTYAGQIWSSLLGRKPDPQERDLVFYMEKEPAKFLTRLKRIK